jgi:hypothetical protein
MRGTVFRKCIGACGRVLKFDATEHEILARRCSVCDGEGWQRLNRKPTRSERWTAAQYRRFQKPATMGRWMALDPALKAA